MKVQLCGEVHSNDTAALYRAFGFTACCPDDIRKAIETCPDGEELILEVNSGGGSVYAGFEMYSLLRAHNGRTVAEIQSIAASAMSVVTCACDTVRISPVAEMMIHRASLAAEGTSREMKQAAQMLDTIDESILTAYLQKTGGKSDRDALSRMMRRETFLTAQQAIDCGLADELSEASGTDSAPPLPGLAVARAGTATPAYLIQLPPVEDLTRLKAELDGTQTKGVSAMPDTKNMETPTTPEQLFQQYPDLVKQIQAAAVKAASATTPQQLAELYPQLAGQIAKAAADAERERLAKIDEAAIPGFEDLIAEAKADPDATAESVSFRILKAQKASGAAYIASVRQDAQSGNVNRVSAAAVPATDTDDYIDAAAKEAVALWRGGLS